MLRDELFKVAMLEYLNFVSRVPTPTVGNIYLVPKNKVFIIDVPFLDMM